MSRPGGPVLLGSALHVALTLALYGLQRLALPSGTATYTIWYSSSELVLKAVAAVGPGFVAAWVYKRKGMIVGAMAGVIGVLAEVVITIVGFGIPLGEYPGHLASGLIAGALAAGLTNAVAGVAGEALRGRLLPSTASLQGGPAASGRPAELGR